MFSMQICRDKKKSWHKKQKKLFQPRQLFYQSKIQNCLLELNSVGIDNT